MTANKKSIDSPVIISTENILNEEKKKKKEREIENRPFVLHKAPHTRLFFYYTMRSSSLA